MPANFVIMAAKDVYKAKRGRHQDQCGRKRKKYIFQKIQFLFFNGAKISNAFTNGRYFS